jgi:restriction endonuclease
MKFKFKIQQYQSDAVEAVVRVFAGQGLRGNVVTNFKQIIAIYIPDAERKVL